MADEPQVEKTNEVKKKSNIGYIVTIIIMALVIIGLVAYIVVLKTSEEEESSSSKSKKSKATNNTVVENMIDEEDEEEDEEEYEVKNTTKSSSTRIDTSSKNGKVKLGDTFTFNNFELTIGKEVSFSKVEASYSDKNGTEVVAVPITIKNVGEETKSFNYFYTTYFGSKGTELSGIEYYFEDSIYKTGSLRSGGSINAKMYFIYDGDGTYAVEFNDFTDKYELEFEVKK